MKKTDLLNKRFGSLVVIAEAPTRTKPNGGKVTMWHCRCDCGKELDVLAYSLLHGKTKSCGCLKPLMISRAIYKHGGIEDRLYSVWAGIKARCNNPNNTSYKRYGGRGIKMCFEWETDYNTFKAWAMANGYDPNASQGECTIDRIDNDGWYSPENCRWVGMDIQSLNKCPRENITKVTFNEKTLSLSEWAAATGLTAGAIRERLRRGWNVADALTVPKQIHRKRSMC